MAGQLLLRRIASLLAPLALCLAVVLGSPGCVTEPITGRSQLALLSEGEANELGVQAFGQIMGELKISGDPVANSQVERVARRIAAVTDVRMAEEDREGYTWEVKVIDDPKTANAFALPGGKMAVYTGILPVARDDTGLAVVMAHEVAHAYAQHGRKRISEGILTALGAEVVSAALEDQVSPEVHALIIAGLGIGLTVGVELPFSRDDESAADEIGLILMAEAGYDPRAAVGFWERMEAGGAGGGIPEFLSTHPSPENRIARIKELLPKAVLIYETARVTPK